MRNLARVVIPGAAVASLLLGGCLREGDEEFIFTPLPHTQVVLPDGTAIPVGESPSGGLYLADQVLVVVETARISDLEARLQRLGFRRGAVTPLAKGMSYVQVIVPVGSAIQARDLISEMDGVESADLNSLRLTMGTPATPE